MTINDKINQMSIEKKAKLFASWTVSGACNDFGILPNRKCDGKCEICIKDWLEQGVNKDGTMPISFGE